MNILSVFDGMSCGQIAAERAELQVDNYYASEIETASIKVTQHNYPNTIQLGDIKEVKVCDLPNIPDLLIGGSPCQDISVLNREQKGLEGDNSSLFYEFLRLKDECIEVNHKLYFLLENVQGKKESVEQISKILGVKPLRFDSRWVSAQTRKRLFWTNIPVTTIPQNKYLTLKDILQTDVSEDYNIIGARLNWLNSEGGKFSIKKKFTFIDPDRAGCLTKRADKSWNCTYVNQNGILRKLTPVEWERLQTVPDNYTSIVSDDKRYEMLGNGWTVDIIAHIFSHLPNKFKRENYSKILR